MNEYILLAAIHYLDLKLKREIDDSLIYPKNVNQGLVFCGYRHPHCMYSMVAITGLRSAEAGQHIEGFLTSHNRFVDRKEGLIIALAANQIADLNNIRGKNLHSEDLYQKFPT